MKSLYLGIAALVVMSVMMSSGCVQQQDQPQTGNGEVNEYTLSEVSQHGSSEDCWLVINSKVYDVTNWISAHPGGNAIVEGCGKDSTDLFETRPMGSGTPHSQNARSLLNNYYIGDLK